MNDKPRAFEPRRLLDALRAQAGALTAVALLALFGGALVARLAVHDHWLARAVARITPQPHAVFVRALEDDVLERALRGASSSWTVEALRTRTRVGFSGHDRLSVEVRGSEEERQETRRLADALAETYVALALEPLERAARERQQQTRNAREPGEAELRRARDALQAALAREGHLELERDLANAQATVDKLERRDGDGRVEPVRVSTKRRPSSSPEALAEAQRALSRALASGADPAELAALHARIERLQTPAASTPEPAPPRAAPENEPLREARALRERLSAAWLHVAPLRARLADAETRLERLGPDEVAPAIPARALVVQHAELRVVEPRALRWLVSLLAPLIAVLALASFYVLRELSQARIVEASELSYWLSSPVLGTSAWPARADALEALVDALADPALEVLGTTLLLPLSELERPLAATLVAQLNARAQRHFRSPTGSRVTIAQDWQGELMSPRLRRAAAAADRVLWVVAADAHRGVELSARRAALVGCPQAAVLVDAEGRGARSVGASQTFWRAPAALAKPVPGVVAEAAGGAAVEVGAAAVIVSSARGPQP